MKIGSLVRKLKPIKMNNQVKFIAKQFELQNRLFVNAISGLDETSGSRLNEFTNHVAWISGHAVNSRYMMAVMLGLDVKPPHPELFSHGSSIEANAIYPDVMSTIKDFEAISSQIVKALANTTDEVMESKAPMPCPMGDKVGDLFAFFAHHESYHIGQLGILRKYFGNEAMSYN